MNGIETLSPSQLPSSVPGFRIRLGICDLLMRYTPPHATKDGTVKYIHRWVRCITAGFLRNIIRIRGRSGPEYAERVGYVFPLWTPDNDSPSTTVGGGVDDDLFRIFDAYAHDTRPDGIFVDTRAHQHPRLWYVFV